MADTIAQIIKADLFQILMVHPYSVDYHTCIEESKEDWKTNKEIELANDIDISSYDEIYLGSPIWFGTLANPIKSFIKKHNFNGKKIHLFVSHGGGGISNALTDLKQLIPNAIIDNNYLEICSYHMEDYQDKILSWLK